MYHQTSRSDCQIHSTLETLDLLSFTLNLLLVFYVLRRWCRRVAEGSDAFVDVSAWTGPQVRGRRSRSPGPRSLVLITPSFIFYYIRYRRIP
jgi:hypothetical protein